MGCWNPFLDSHGQQVKSGASASAALDKIDIAAWSHTAMVGGTVCNIESLDPIEVWKCPHWKNQGRDGFSKVFHRSVFFWKTMQNLSWWGESSGMILEIAFEMLKGSFRRFIGHSSGIRWLQYCLSIQSVALQMAALKMSTCFEGSFTLPDLAARTGLRGCEKKYCTKIGEQMYGWFYIPLYPMNSHYILASAGWFNVQSWGSCSQWGGATHFDLPEDSAVAHWLRLYITLSLTRATYQLSRLYQRTVY